MDDSISERAQSPARASPREPSLREPSLREPSLREPSLREPSIQGPPSVRKPSIQDYRRSSLVSRQESPKKSPYTSPLRSAKGSPLKGSVAHSPAKQVSLDVMVKDKSSLSSANHKRASKEDTMGAILDLEPQGQRISKHIEQLNDSVKKLALHNTDAESPTDVNIDRIAEMSIILTNEANALRQSIKHLSEDICRTENGIGQYKEDITDFPYHLFLLEIIVNKIQMKCECFDMDCSNLVMSARFLGKHPIILYDSNTNGCVDDFYKINIGKSIMFAMTYDKICAIQEFEIILDLNKQPPCSHCVTKIGTTKMDFTKEFLELRDELCQKWKQEQPNDNIICTTSTPLVKNQFYILCSDGQDSDAIGIIEVSVRMSFLGKEITTAFSASPRPKGTSRMLKEGNGMTMYSCQNVEMDEQGKILLDEDTFGQNSCRPLARNGSPISDMSTISTRKNYNTGGYMDQYHQAGLGEFRIRDLNDEINKLMREKRHWEVQIKSLGGPDHARVGPRMLDQDGREVPGNRGYKYFGAAKDLPGVRELFEQEPPPPPRRTRADLMRDVDADYYGYRDDDDGLLIPLERDAEKDAIARAVDEWKRNKEENKEQDLPEEENIYPEDPDDKRVDDDDDGEPQIITSHVAVPSQKDIEEALLRKKKQELLERYGCLDVKMEES